jgi:ADP-ribose pyrophosphatase YjhB (NUDIX family)
MASKLWYLPRFKKQKSKEDSWRIPGGFLEDSWRIPGGFLEDSWRIPGGFLEDYKRIRFKTKMLSGLS